MATSPVAADAPSALMDRVYRHQRHIYDLTRKYFLLGRDHLIDRLEPPAGGTVLELGCGTGRNLIVAARRYPEAAFHGLDVSAAMLATARAKVARVGLEGRIELASGDATCFDPAATCDRERFDRVFFAYSLSMIPAWRAALAHAAGLVAPGGRLLVVDFGDQRALPAWFRVGLWGWLAKFHVAPRPDLGAQLAALASPHDGEAETRPLYRGYAFYGELRQPPARAPRRPVPR